MRIVTSLKLVWLSHQTTALLLSSHVLLCTVFTFGHSRILFLLPFLWVYDAFIIEYLLNIHAYLKYLKKLSTDIVGATSFIDIPSECERIYFDNGNLIIESTTSCNCDIYSLSGQLVRTLVLNKGMNTVSGLTKVTYIVNGQKIFVR